MKDFAIDWKPYQTEFRGVTVKMELLPLTTKNYMVVQPYASKFKSTEEIKAMLPAEQDALMESMLEMQTKALPVLQGHVRNLTGFTINKQPPSNEMLAEQTIFFLLVLDIIVQLIVITTLGDEEKKTSGLPSGTGTAEDDLTE